LGIERNCGFEFLVLSFSHYNLMITDMDDVLTPFAKRNGIGLINAAGLHMGILTEAGPPAWHPAPAEVRESWGEGGQAMPRARP